MWGFSVEAELIENADKQDELCCYVSRVEDKSVAMQNGIIKGDEIMVINGAIVSDLDMMYLESVLQEELALCMMMRSSRTEPPDLAGKRQLGFSGNRFLVYSTLNSIIIEYGQSANKQKVQTEVDKTCFQVAQRGELRYMSLFTEQ